MGKINNKHYRSGITKRLYRQKAALMWQVMNTKKANISTESEKNLQSSVSTETVNNFTVSVLSESIGKVGGENVESNTDGMTIDIVDNTELKLVSDNTSNTSQEKQVGRRIINVTHFFKELQQISAHGPLNCGLTSVRIISEIRVGLISKLKLKCIMCNMTFILQTDNPIDEMDINTSAVAGAISIGCGYSQLKELTCAIGLSPMSNQLFMKKMNLVNEKWEKELTTSLKEAATEEYDLAVKEGRVNSNGIPVIDVIADGCYSKRSYKKNYSSLSGAATIIGRRTNKILFMGIKNKYCHMCALSQNKGVETKDHVCYKNYSGPSTGMESEIILEGFKRSLEMYNLIYGRLISDGDANTYSKILQARPYKNFTVEKVECRNHLLRNFCNKLLATTIETKYPKKFRNYLTKKRILSMRRLIIQRIKVYKETGNVSSLHEDIMNVAEHAFERHNKCKIDYCSNNEDNKNICPPS